MQASTIQHPSNSGKMSMYNSYNSSASRLYDTTRNPIGARHHLGIFLSRNHKTFAESRVLDAGCGTGNYAEFFLQHGVGHVTLLDASEHMLKEAMEKLKVHGNRVSVQHQQLPALAFPGNSFDGVMLNFVLHHLENDDGSFENTRDALRSAWRCLKPGGSLMITTFSQRQLVDGMWFLALVGERPLKAHADRFLAADKLANFLSSELGFEDVTSVSCVSETLLSMDNYFDLDGPLNADWRGTMSLWSFCTPDEIHQVHEKVASLRKRGLYEKFMEDRERIRRDCGSATLITAVKPASNLP